MLEAAEVELDDLRSRPVSRLSMLRKTGRTREQAWNESSLVERRESLRRRLGGGYLTIGPGRTGIKGFQVERVLDRDKLVPHDFDEDGGDLDQELS